MPRRWPLTASRVVALLPVRYDSSWLALGAWAVDLGSRSAGPIGLSAVLGAADLPLLVVVVAGVDLPLPLRATVVVWGVTRRRGAGPEQQICEGEITEAPAGGDAARPLAAVVVGNIVAADDDASDDRLLPIRILLEMDAAMYVHLLWHA